MDEQILIQSVETTGKLAILFMIIYYSKFKYWGIIAAFVVVNLVFTILQSYTYDAKNIYVQIMYVIIYGAMVKHQFGSWGESTGIIVPSALISVIVNKIALSLLGQKQAQLAL